MSACLPSEHVDEYLADEGDGMRVYRCDACGAEWWEDTDD
jgi:hypothetical protein